MNKRKEKFAKKIMKDLGTIHSDLLAMTIWTVINDHVDGLTETEFQAERVTFDEKD